jgi:hypothetical protein
MRVTLHHTYPVTVVRDYASAPYVQQQGRVYAGLHFAGRVFSWPIAGTYRPATVAQPAGAPMVVGRSRSPQLALCRSLRPKAG